RMEFRSDSRHVRARFHIRSYFRRRRSQYFLTGFVRPPAGRSRPRRDTDEDLRTAEETAARLAITDLRKGWQALTEYRAARYHPGGAVAILRHARSRPRRRAGSGRRGIR